jgi:hypothetical protein
LWADAADTSTITATNNLVTSWSDKSGNANLLTANNNPHTGLSTQNSLNVIELDGDDYFEKENFSLPSSGDLQVFILCDVTSQDHWNDSILSLDALKDFQIDSGNVSGFKGRLTSTGILTTQADILNSNNLNGFNLFSASFDSTLNNYTFRINGKLIGLAQSTNSNLSLSQTLRIFTNRGEDQYPTGSVAEVIFCEDVTESNRQKFEGYLSHKWGVESELDSSHPYKTNPPTQ